MAGLPGEALVRRGLEDLASRRRTAAACLAEIAAPRLRRAGLLRSATSTRYRIEPELRLYRILRRRSGDAYTRYNALVRELVSFEQALDRRQRRQQGDEG